MPIEKSKCRCYPGYKCSAPLHGEVVILSCKRNCGLGCAEPTEKQNKNAKYR